MTKKKSLKGKQIRREGENLDFFIKKNSNKLRTLLTPGEHGLERNKITDYGLILRTKQKIKRYYCVFEKQFKKIFIKLKKNFFFSIELINFMERRLDNIVYRMNFSFSRKESKQYIIHGYVFVNFFKIKSPAFIVYPGDFVSIKKEFLLKKIKYEKNNLKIINWIYLNYFNLYGLILSVPNKIPFLINNNIILDIYK